ncbi:MAG: hypothetical protein ACLQNE_34435 [Thermoguttaceae bacterium]
MRREHRIPIRSGFRLSDWMRMASMITFLGLLVMLMLRFRDPSLWAWVGPGDEGGTAKPAAAERAEAGKVPAEQKTAPSPDAAPAVPENVEIGTDLDDEEAGGFREEVQAVEDRGLTNRPEEMPAYNRIVRWVGRQPFDVMRSRAKKGAIFNDFVHDPNACRGKLFEFKLRALRVLKYPEKTSDGVQLHEMWGWRTSSGAWPYVLVVLDLPEGMPVGERIDEEEVRFVGYFLKLQGYQPANAKPNARPLFAPLLIGRVRRIVLPPQQTDWQWAGGVLTGMGLFGGLALASGLTLVIVWVLFRGKNRERRLSPLETRPPGPVSVEDWFDRLETRRGNGPEQTPEFEKGEPLRNGNGEADAELFHGGLDIDRPAEE